MIVEVITFRLPDGADEAAFLALEATTQARVSSARGFMRRTTARDGDEWCVIQLWDSTADAESGWDEAFEGAVEGLHVRRYGDLGG